MPILTVPRPAVPFPASPCLASPLPTSAAPQGKPCAGVFYDGMTRTGFLGLTGDLFPLDLTLAHDDNGTCESRQTNRNSNTFRYHAHTPIAATDATNQETFAQTRETSHSIRQLERTLSYHNPARSCRNSTNLTRHYPAMPEAVAQRRPPRQTRPIHTATTKLNPLPYPASPRRAIPHQVMPIRTSPRPALTTKLFTHIKASNHKTAKARAIVANANGFTGKGKHIIDNLKMKAVINNGDDEIEFPPRLKSGADSNNAGAIYNHRTQIQIQRLIAIGIKFFGDAHAEWDFIGGNKNGGLKQIFIALPPFPLNLEISGRTNHRAFKVGGWLNHARAICVEILTPLLGIINCARLLFATLAHRGEFGHREFVMQHRGSTNYGNINLIHGSPHRTHKAPYYVRRCLAIGRARFGRVVRGFISTSLLVSLNRSIGVLNKKSPSFRLLDKGIIPQCETSAQGNIGAALLSAFNQGR